MYHGDQSRKRVLIDFGFRLPSALDNRPLTFLEFSEKIPQTIYLSATPDTWEISLAREEAFRKPCQGRHDGVTEQLVRPTGIVDPKIVIRPTQNQISDLVGEIIKRKKRNERVLVTTLTKKTAEDLSAFLNERKYTKFPEFKKLQAADYPVVHYLHSDIETLERTDILDNLRQGKYDVIIGINLLREGLDLPEVSLVAILDADKEGFLRSEVSLIQTMGRASRHIRGTVIMYADIVTKSMKKAIEEIERRREIQLAYNNKYRIIPQNIIKPIREKLVEKDEEEKSFSQLLDQKKRIRYKKLLAIDSNQLTPQDKARLIRQMERQMKDAASSFNFELAAEIRDKIIELKESN
jgi:excinuclease ABC subunit B